MLRVKVFDEEHELDLEETMNLFLETLHEKQVKSVQYEVSVANDLATDEQVFCYSAMIVYHTTEDE